MASSRTKSKVQRIALLTPSAPDLDMRPVDTRESASANAPHHTAIPEDGRRSGKISDAEYRREQVVASDEIVAVRAELAALEEEAEHPRRRASGPRPTVSSGRVLLRLPLSVHQELIARAEAERTSLNQLVLAYISRGLGQDTGHPVSNQQAS